MFDFADKRGIRICICHSLFVNSCQICKKASHFVKHIALVKGKIERELKKWMLTLYKWARLFINWQTGFSHFVNRLACLLVSVRLWNFKDGGS